MIFYEDSHSIILYERKREEKQINLLQADSGQRIIPSFAKVAQKIDRPKISQFLGMIIFVVSLAGLFLSLLFRDKVYGKRIIISLLMIPIMISPMVIGIIWRFILNPEIGIANYILKMVGLQPLIWLGDIKYALSTIILIDIWQWTPFLFIIFLSGMQGISPNLYEAAEVDGASEWGLIRYITIPMLKPIMYIGILIRSIDSFKMFDLVYILTRGGPVNSTETASLYIYKTGFNFFNMGKASTMSYILLIIMTFLIQRFIGKKEIV